MFFSSQKLYATLLPVRRLILNVQLFFANISHILKREAFYCNALNGKSPYNICINSDMTVSCNCVDIDGSGHIGDMSVNTLEEIFDGKRASKFRKALSRGILPIGRCLQCPERCKTTRKEAKVFLSDYTTPKLGIMVENTVQCNLTCVNCRRSAILKTRKKYRLSLSDIDKISKNIKNCSINCIHFFNLGEPFLSDTIREEITILKQHNPEATLLVSTNGLLLHHGDKMEAALLFDYIFISLDGASNESVKKYQTGGSFDIAYNNMKTLVGLRNTRLLVKPVIEWKYVVFSWNDSEYEIEKAIDFARDANVDVLSFWPGVGSASQISDRFRHDEYFEHLGVKSWKGREIDFRT
jgi:uncharacterized Fe-S cluster-containing radical SAM superfamily protein